MYLKDFEKWNSDKQYIDKHPKNERFYFNEGDIWWASLGVNIGVEIDGKKNHFERPILIIKKINRNSALVVPLTSTIRENDKRYVTYELKNGERKSVILSQIRLVDIRRLKRRADVVISVEKFKEIKIKLKNLI